MKVQGKITALLPERSGISQRTGQEWKSLPFIIEFFDDGDRRFADRMQLETFDTKEMDLLRKVVAYNESNSPQIEVAVTVGHNVREYQGRHYNDLRTYRVELPDGVMLPAEPAQPADPAPSTGSAQTTQAQAPADAAPADPLPF